MDLSTEYIKMCEEAIEIQTFYSGGKWKYGDFYVHDRLTTKKEVEVYNSYLDGLFIEHSIWIPRQDQLQEFILKDNKISSFELIADLYFCFTHEQYTTDLCIFNTLEKVWLAYVMHKKFKKIWNNETKKWNGLK